MVIMSTSLHLPPSPLYSPPHSLPSICSHLHFLLFTSTSLHVCYSDLDLSALRAMGLVMSGLVLQSKFKTSDVFEEKGKLFLK